MYTYFLFSVLSEQYLDTTFRNPRNEADLVVPAFALLELVMYLGLLKVAETLINPFGVDDNSFDLIKFLQDARLVRAIPHNYITTTVFFVCVYVCICACTCALVYVFSFFIHISYKLD